MAGREPFPQTPRRPSQDPDDDQMDALRGVFYVSGRQQVQFVGPDAANKSASGTWCADARLHRETWCRLLELDFPVKTLHRRSVRYTLCAALASADSALIGFDGDFPVTDTARLTGG